MCLPFFHAIKKLKITFDWSTKVHTYISAFIFAFISEFISEFIYKHKDPTLSQWKIHNFSKKIIYLNHCKVEEKVATLLRSLSLSIILTRVCPDTPPSIQ